MQSIFLALCALLLIGCSQPRKASSPPAQHPEEAASNALVELQNLVNEQNYRNLGFESIDEVKRARFGQPMAVYYLGLERMKAFQPGQNVNQLLTPSAETIYPVMVDGHVRTGVTIVRGEQGYESSSFGNADIVRRLSGYRQSPAEFAVRIPAFNLYFVGRHVDSRVLLVPITNNPRLKAQTGEATPLEVVVGQLRPYVDSYDGRP